MASNQRSSSLSFDLSAIENLPLSGSESPEIANFDRVRSMSAIVVICIFCLMLAEVDVLNLISKRSSGLASQ